MQRPTHLWIDLYRISCSFRALARHRGKLNFSWGRRSWSLLDNGCLKGHCYCTAATEALTLRAKLGKQFDAFLVGWIVILTDTNYERVGSGEQVLEAIPPADEQDIETRSGRITDHVVVVDLRGNVQRRNTLWHARALISNCPGSGATHFPAGIALQGAN